MAAYPFLVIICAFLVLPHIILIFGEQDCNKKMSCDHYYDNAQKRGDCATRDCQDKVPNVPLIRAGYCFNNGSGICKLMAGRYEFYFDSWKDKFLYSAPADKYVDANGFHKRVPVAYQVNGSPLYVDRALNWADEFVNKTGPNATYNLLSMSSFEWCSHAVRASWPYKSAIKKGKFHIYFFNRQTCIYDSEKKKTKQYNTRFLHKSDRALDLDMNPTIFAIEVSPGNGTKLIKHKRQLWSVSDFEVLEKPAQNVDHFVRMKRIEESPIINEERGVFMSSKAYTTDLCLTDFYSWPKLEWKPVLAVHCGDQEFELMDIFTAGDYDHRIGASLHNIPIGYTRGDNFEMKFFGVNTMGEEFSWFQFVKDGLVFTAFTTIPISGEVRKLRVLMFYADIKSQPKSDYDEHYPMPKFSDYIAEYRGRDWELSERSKKEKVIKDLNYVDDIAYLHRCKTVLSIFGPLYTEQPADKFSPDVKSQIGSITALGMWETTNAFTADLKDRILWALHRTNYVGKYSYTCGKDGRLVTAVREDKYFFQDGQTVPTWPPIHPKTKHDLSEEWLFKQIGVYKGSLDSPEPPDYKPFKGVDGPSPEDFPDGDGSSSTPSWIYWAAGAAILLITGLAVLCLTIQLRGGKKGHHKKVLRSGVTSKITTHKTRRAAPSAIGKRLTNTPHTSRSRLSGSSSRGGRSPSSRGPRVISLSRPGRKNAASSRLRRSASQGSNGSMQSSSSKTRSGGSLRSAGSNKSQSSRPPVVQKFPTNL